MRRSYFQGTLAAGFLFLGQAGVAAEPAPAEQLPAPRVQAPQQLSPPVFLYSYPRVSRYEVWQNLGVDRFGRFRPLVIYSPYGAYYRYNHAPYPWAETHPLEFIPQVVGSP